MGKEFAVSVRLQNIGEPNFFVLPANRLEPCFSALDLAVRHVFAPAERKAWFSWSVGCFETNEYTLNGYSGIMFNLRALTNDFYLQSFGVMILDDAHDDTDVLVYVTSDGTAAEVRAVSRVRAKLRYAWRLIEIRVVVTS